MEVINVFNRKLFLAYTDSFISTYLRLTEKKATYMLTFILSLFTQMKFIIKRV